MPSRRLKSGAIITGDDERALDDAVRQIDEAQDRAAQRDALWGTDNRARMTRLCKSFPTLVMADGVEPWNAERFLRWVLTSGAPGSGARHAAKFVLQVWNSETDWAAWARTPVADDGLGISDAELAPFNVCQALGVWDADHADAFRTWCYLPFWP